MLTRLFETPEALLIARRQVGEASAQTHRPPSNLRQCRHTSLGAQLHGSVGRMAMYVNARVANQWVVLASLVVAAVLIRVGVRLAFGEQYFWKNSYSLYYTLAENIISGKGFCLGTKCAWLPPLYPLFLTMSAAAEKSYLLVIVPQAVMGAGTAVCAFLIGRHIFNAPAGILACAMATFYPYYV